MSLSQRSLTTQPAALVAKLPRTMTVTRGAGGVPLPARNTAQRAGIIRMSRPAGLSHLSRRIMVSSRGSCSGCCVLSIFGFYVWDF